MGINFSKFSEQVQNMIKNALSDNKIDAAEVRAMNLGKNVANELMKQLAGDSMYLGDGFYKARGAESTLILLDKPTNNMFVELTDDSLSRYRQTYENAEKGLYRDGKIYLVDKNGKIIKDSEGNDVCKVVSFEETKKDVPSFFKEDGRFDIKNIQEYLNNLPETNQDYQTLINDIEEASREGAYWSIKNFSSIQKERFLEIYKAIENHNLGQATKLMYSFFQEECQGFDKEVLSKIRSGLERLTGAKQAGPALYNALSWMAENIDNLVGRDKNNIGYAQRFVVGLNNADKGLGDFIFSTEGLVTMGAIATGEALLYKTASTVAPYIGGAIHSFFAEQGFELIYNGSEKVLTGETLEEVAEGGQKIGHGLPLVISPVSKLIKNTEALGKNINKIKEAKSIKELDNILNDILAEPLTPEERLNYCHEHYLKRLELQQENNKINKTDSKTFNIGNNTADNVIQYLKSNYVSFDYIKEGDKFIIRISDDTKITNSNRYDYYIFEKGQLKEKRIQAGKNELGEQNWQSHTARSRSLNSGLNPEPVVEGVEAHNAAKKLRDVQIEETTQPSIIQNSNYSIEELKTSIETKLEKYYIEDKEYIQNAIDFLEEDSIECYIMLDKLLDYYQYCKNAGLNYENFEIGNFLYNIGDFTTTKNTSIKNNIPNLYRAISQLIDSKEPLTNIDNFLVFISERLIKSEDLTVIFLERFDNFDGNMLKVTKNEKVFQLYCLVDNKFISYLTQHPNFADRLASWDIRVFNDEIMNFLIKEYESSLTLEPKVLEVMRDYKSTADIQEISPEKAKILEEFLDDHELGEELYVYRGEDFGFVDSIKIGDETLGDILRRSVDLDQHELDKLVATTLSDYRLQSNRFLSTSLNDTKAASFGGLIMWEIKLPKNTKAATIDVMVTHRLNYEAEVLLQKDSKYMITNIEFHDGRWYIEATLEQD